MKTPRVLAFKEIFKFPPSGASKRFLRCCEGDDDAVREREWLLSLWQEYQPQADLHFVSQFARHPEARFWEMYLGCFLGRRYRIRSMESGPDFFVDLDGQRLAVEATAAEAGTGANAVPALIPNGESRIAPDSQIALRYANRLKEKHLKLLSDKKKGLIRPDDSLVIAINGYLALNGRFVNNRRVPSIARVLLGFGRSCVVYDTENFQRVDSYYESVRALKTSNGSRVENGYYLSGEYEEISAILVSHVPTYPPHQNLGYDFTVIHNPFAKHGLDDGVFSGTRQMRVEFLRNGRIRLHVVELPPHWGD